MYQRRLEKPIQFYFVIFNDILQSQRTLSLNTQSIMRLIANWFIYFARCLLWFIYFTCFLHEVSHLRVGLSIPCSKKGDTKLLMLNRFSTLCPNKNVHIFIFWITVKNQVIWVICGIYTETRRNLKKWYVACSPQLKNVTTIPCERQILCIGSNFRCFSQKIGCIWNSQVLEHMPNKFSDKQNCRNC